MNGNGSVAPKERINIMYKATVGEQRREVELPLKLLVVGDYTREADDRAVEDRKPIELNKNNFNDVLEGLGVNLDLHVPNRLSGNEDDELGVHLGFKTIKDFRPESIVEQVPELRKMIELRKALMAVKGPLGNIPGFRKAIQKIVDNEESRKRLTSELASS